MHLLKWSDRTDWVWALKMHRIQWLYALVIKKSSKEVQQWNRGRNKDTCNRWGEHGNYAQGNVILTWTSGAFYWGIYTQSNNKLLQEQIHFWASQFKATVQDKAWIAEAFPFGNFCRGTHKSRSWNSHLKGQNNGLKQFGACPASMAMMVDRRPSGQAHPCPDCTVLEDKRKVHR